MKMFISHHAARDARFRVKKQRGSRRVEVPHLHDGGAGGDGDDDGGDDDGGDGGDDDDGGDNDGGDKSLTELSI